MENKSKAENTQNTRKQEISNEQLAQVALGNTAAVDETDRDQADLLAIPKTSGTGGNPSGARKDSLIINEELDGEDRYQDGDNNDPGKNED